MKKLDKYEKEIKESFEKGEWQSVSDVDAQKNQYIKYAKNSTRKNKRISIRISEKDLIAIKAKSLEEGIPYQTLIASILHKYVSGKLMEKG